MKHHIFTTEQKDIIMQKVLADIVYTPFETHFEPIQISENRWVLPDTFWDNKDVQACLTEENRPIIDAIIKQSECREINEEEKLNPIKDAEAKELDK